MNRLLAYSTGILSLAVAGFWGVAQNTASLEVVVSGLPKGVDAAVVLTGPGGTRLRIVESVLVSQLGTGNYVLRADRVSAGGNLYAPNPASHSLTLVAGRRYRVEIRYARVAGDTEAGTVLELGQTWKQGGLELTLRLLRTNPDGLLIEASLTSRRQGDLVFRLTQDNFSASSNLGQPVKMRPITGSFVAPPGRTVRLGYLTLTADLADPGLTEIIVVVSGISTITEARWRVPVEK
ncbi:hypothetical protein [Calidithermus chliarophilus]|uniref:hypothetical protein n=1 Tax=Calidithermus chliarophilus TaxID=52023 RepID=UPI0012F65B30|nr:hypothetical protein [Calidithermus chliarophilus]